MGDDKMKMIPDYIEAHDYCTNNKQKLVDDQICGCFYCGKIFEPSQIEEWIEDSEDNTALCPYCGIDSIIGESSGYPITQEFLKKMNAYWFG